MALKYPPELKKDRWTKEKGVIAKVLKRNTGVGEALAALEDAYDKVAWENTTVTPDKAEDIDKTVKNAAAELTALIGKVPEVESTAKEAAAACRKNAAIPKDTAEYLDDVVAKAKKFERDVRETMRDICSNASAEKQRLDAAYDKVFGQIKALANELHEEVGKTLAALDDKQREGQKALRKAEVALADVGAALTDGRQKDAQNAEVEAEKAAVELADLQREVEACVKKAKPDSEKRRKAIFLDGSKRLDDADQKKLIGALDKIDFMEYKFDERREKLTEMAENAGKAAAEAREAVRGGAVNEKLFASICNRTAVDAVQLFSELDSQMRTLSAKIENAGLDILNAKEAKEQEQKRSFLERAHRSLINGGGSLNAFHKDLKEAKSSVQVRLSKLPESANAGNPAFKESLGDIKKAMEGFAELKAEMNVQLGKVAKYIGQLKQLRSE